MGVLEDAIREHLELKRRHGAADDEVRRQEAEVLGPARREAAAPSSEEAKEAAEPATAEPSVAEPASAEPAPPVTEPEPQPPAEPVDEETVIAEPHPPQAESESAGAPEDATPVEEAPPSAGPAAEDDFPQETPEQDRLDFERKPPPRDFDFD